MPFLKTSLVALAGAMTLGVLAHGALAADPVTLNVWSDPVRLTMFDLYDKTHDNVTLNVTTIDPAGLVAKIQLGMQSKSEVPDVIFMNDIGYAAQLSTRRSNYLLDLTGQGAAGDARRVLSERQFALLHQRQADVHAQRHRP